MEQLKPVRQEDLLEYRFLSGLRLAPGGDQAAFVVSSANKTENTYEHRLWLSGTKGLRQLTDLGAERSFAWLNDHSLLFPAVRSAAEKKRREQGDPFTAFYALDLQGGEALPWLTLPMQAEGFRVLDENHLLVFASASLDCPALYAMPQAEKEAWLERRKQEKDYEVFTELPFWGNGRGITNGSRALAYLVQRQPLEITPLLQVPEDLICHCVLGDEIFLAYTAWEKKYPLQGFCLRAWNWRTGVCRELPAQKALRPQGMEPVGEQIFLLATEAARHGLNENAWVYTLDPIDGKVALLRREEYNFYNSVGSDCRMGRGRGAVGTPEGLYHLTTRGGSAVLHLLRTDGEDLPVLTREGSMDCFDIADGRLLYVGLYEMRLQELYACSLPGGIPERLSHFNDQALAGCYVASPQRLCVCSCGREIEGWVLLPRNFDPAKRYPAVLDIHGGPKTVYGPVFCHEMQMWASMGYFVFFCNPMGSDGGTNEFMDIRGRYGETDFQNLMDFTDAVLALWPQIDAARLCETGGSYGGFMTNWIIGHTNRFCCAASQRSIANWLSFYGMSDIGYYFASDQTDASLYADQAKLWAQSPLKYAGNVQTPTLFIHSDEDYRCPMAEGIQMYAALADRGVETRLCLFHGENHELSRSGKPLHRQRRLKEITDWFLRFAPVEEDRQ